MKRLIKIKEKKTKVATALASVGLGATGGYFAGSALGKHITKPIRKQIERLQNADEDSKRYLLNKENRTYQRGKHVYLHEGE